MRATVPLTPRFLCLWIESSRGNFMFFKPYLHLLQLQAVNAICRKSEVGWWALGLTQKSLKALQCAEFPFFSAQRMFLWWFTCILNSTSCHKHLRFQKSLSVFTLHHYILYLWKHIYVGVNILSGCLLFSYGSNPKENSRIRNNKIKSMFSHPFFYQFFRLLHYRIVPSADDGTFSNLPRPSQSDRYLLETS